MENHTQATERDRKVRNQQLKVNWQNRCKKIDEIGTLCKDKPWEYCKQKAAPTYIQKQRPALLNRERATEGTLASDGGLIHKN